MAILITGAAGFIGQHLTESLGKEEIESYPKLFVLDKKKDFPCDLNISDSIICDITDDKDIDRTVDFFKDPCAPKITACIHLAAIAAPNHCEKDPKLAWDTNVRGTYNVLNLLHKIGTRKIVFMSSAHVYGIGPLYMPTNESHPFSLHDTYTVTKIIGESICELFYKNHGISYTALRLFNAYGPGQSPDYFLGRKLKQAIEGGPITMYDGEVTKDWIYISDVINAIKLAVNTEYVGALNIGTGIETNLNTIAGIIGKVFAKDIIQEENPNKAGPTRMRCDSSRARDTLKWEPKISIEEGLKLTIDSLIGKSVVANGTEIK